MLIDAIGTLLKPCFPQNRWELSAGKSWLRHFSPAGFHQKKGGNLPPFLVPKRHPSTKVIT